MSGDVQPRKRKDKRKKKEGSSLGNIHEPLPQKFRGKSFDDDADASPIIGSADQGEKIHVHNEHGIGGNICVKIVFFLLLGALVTIVGIIFIHSRGSTDVDLPSIEDSRFADYFTGWLDDASDDHGHEPEAPPIEDDGHDENEEDLDRGDEKDEQSEEMHVEKSEEDHAEEEVSGEMNEAADEGSPEGNENEEEDNADDSGDEEADEAGKVFEVFEDDGEVAPKFKVVHRFRHFFNKRKQLEPDKAEEGLVVKRKRHFQVMRNVDEKEEIEEEKEELEESEEDEGKDTTDKLEEDEDDEEDEEESKTDDGSVEEEDNKDQHTENVESEEAEKEDQDETDEDEEMKQVENADGEEEDDTYGKEEEEAVGSDEEEKADNEKEEPENFKDSLGLDEIDESEEALKEEEKSSGPDEGLSIFEEKEETEEVDQEDETEEKFGRDDVKDEEIEEVESKMLDMEEKLNRILREKRREVEQRKMELEEIEIVASLEEKGDEEKELEEQEETESNGVAVKLIVGIALIIAAHMVLIQKWNSLGNVTADEKSEAETEENEVVSVINDTEPIISRRQTLVPEASHLNEYFANEIEEETDEEVDEEEEEEEEEISEEQDYSSDKALVKEGKLWKVEYGNRLTNLTRDNEEYTEEEEEEEELDDEEFEEEEEEEEEVEVEEEEEQEQEEQEEQDEDEDVEEDDYDWKRLEPVKRLVEEPDEPPVPPPRRSHMSGERRGGPQGVDELPEINVFDDFWDGADSNDQGGGGAEEEQEDKDMEDKSEDDDIKNEYKLAEDLADNNPREALKVYEAILSKKPEAIDALIGRAKVLDKIAERERSNHYLKEAINAYKVILTSHENELKNEQFLELSERCINRMRFGGYFKTAIEIHKLLIKRFPTYPKYRNDLAVTYLFLNEIPSARALLNDTLKMWPKNGFALVHYGFILKTADNKHAEAADLLMAGIRTREPGVIDGRFFFHLGDALNRLGRGKEAIEWYDQGVKEGLFLSRYQRSLYNVNRLKGQPWWTHKETTYQDFFKKLEDNWQKIRKEGLNLLNSKGMNLFKEEAENLKDTGDWRQLDLYFRGKKQPNCDKAPFTCSLISSFHPASTCTRGQIKFSVMLPSTHVWPHCGPTNCRLRSHLGLLVPKNTFIRVAEETRSWEEGKLFVFDDSFEHEVWHNGTGPRLVLIVDVWHPELTPNERKYLSPI